MATLTFENPFSEADPERSARATLTPAIFARATFESIRVLDQYRQFRLDSEVGSPSTRTPKTSAMLGLHYRIAAYLASVATLDGPVHFQAISSAARSVFDLALYVHLLEADATSESADRLAAFTRAERFRVAKKTVDFFANRSAPPTLR